MQDFTIVRRGFDTTEVDTYIVNMENEIIKRDQKIEEYRSREDAINRAVIEAQLTADNIVRKATEDANKIRQEATEELKDLKEQSIALRNNLIEFQKSYNTLLRRYLYTGHCTDLTQIFDRLDTLMERMDIDMNTQPAEPEIQGTPRDDAYTHVLSDSAQRINLDEISDAWANSTL